MQRINNLFEPLGTLDNLMQAWKKARKGCGKTRESARFFCELERELLSLQSALQAGIWYPSPYRFFEIYDPKQRQIAVAEFRDRVVHHAVVQILEPCYERIFIHDSYATRSGKGVHAAVFRARQFLQRNDYYLKSDVEKFFDSVDHQILIKLLERKIRDNRFMDVCSRIILHGGKAGKGLPIGSRTSQFFANVYLNHLDHFLKERSGVRYYIRYMDDFVVFDNNRQRLKDVRSMTAEFLEEELKLSLKPTATFLNQHLNGLPFLGRRIFRGTIRLHHKHARRITQRLAYREKQYLSGDISEDFFLQSVNSYWSMLSYYPDLEGFRNSLQTLQTNI